MSLQLKPEEVSAVLKQQLADFEFKSQSYEVGTVLSVGDGIARVHGLEKTMFQLQTAPRRPKIEENSGHFEGQTVEFHPHDDFVPCLMGGAIASRKEYPIGFKRTPLAPMGVPWHRPW